MSEIVKLKVISIILETSEAKTFAFENCNNEKLKYEPGQFLTFIFKNSNGEVRRSYSISSAPGIDENISVTVKRIENGEISRFFINQINIGDEI